MTYPAILWLTQGNDLPFFDITELKNALSSQVTDPISDMSKNSILPKISENLSDLSKRDFRTKHYIIERENLLYGTMRRKNPIIWRKWRNKNQFLNKKVV